MMGWIRSGAPPAADLFCRGRHPSSLGWLLGLPPIAWIDWCTPDGLADLGTAAARSSAPRATSSFCKYVDIAGRAAPLPYYQRLIADVFERKETAMSQAQRFKVCELALAAQAKAGRLA
jgi:hypothetical protein